MSDKRIAYLDLLNIIAIISVIAMHCNGIVHGNPNIRAWNTSLIVECICYFAVPMFFMISGANLMKYRERYNTKEFFKKRCLKVLIPFIAWAIIMFIFKIFITKSISIETINTPINFLNAFFSNKEEATYYFMFEILGIYLVMPLLSLLAKDEYKKTLWLIVGLYFVFNATLPNLFALVGIKWYTGFGMPLSGYAIYVILGYLLSKEELDNKWKILIYVGAVFGILYRYITTFILSKSAGQVIKTTWGYSSWHCMLLTVSVFIIIKDLKIEEINDTAKTIMAKIAQCSFGIYLIHMIVKACYIKVFNINTLSWYFRTFGVLGIYIISLVGVMLMKKIQILRKILP